MVESELVLVDREALLSELGRVFDAQTAETLLSVLDKVAAQGRAAGVTREDFHELKQIVAELAEAQRRTEQRVAELAEAQRKAEIRLAGVEDHLSRMEGTVAELAEAQWKAEIRLAGVEDRLSRLEGTVAELAEAQRKAETRLAGVEDRLSRLEGRVAELAEAQRRTEQRVAELAEAQRKAEIRLAGVEDRLSRLELAIERLVEAQQRTTDTLGALKGRVLEANYRDKAVAYFGRWLRRPQVVAMNSLWETLEARLPEEALDDVILLDLVVRGKPRKQPAAGEVWLAVEVSSVVDEGDVARARRRTALLRQAGYRAIPVVAGEQATPGAEVEARLHRVAVLQDGRGSLWKEALEAWAIA